jgi:hypothetical protein
MCDTNPRAGACRFRFGKRCFRTRIYEKPVFHMVQGMFIDEKDDDTSHGEGPRTAVPKGPITPKRSAFLSRP